MAETPQFENRLERLLAEASSSPAARPEFYRDLLDSQVVIAPHSPIEKGDPSQSVTLQMSTIEYNGILHVPFFLAPKFLPSGTANQVMLPARTFFEITKGSHLILNPGAQYGKIFTPDEVQRLLSGRIAEVDKEFQIRNNGKVLIGQPKQIPSHLLAQLAKFFEGEATALRAWLGWYHNPAVEEGPGYLLAVDAPRQRDFRELAGRISLILRETGTG